MAHQVTESPIGLRPEWHHIEIRLRTIEDVIERCTHAGKAIPEEWLSEHTFLVNRYNEVKL